MSPVRHVAVCSTLAALAIAPPAALGRADAPVRLGVSAGQAEDERVPDPPRPRAHVPAPASLFEVRNTGKVASRARGRRDGADGEEAAHGQRPGLSGTASRMSCRSSRASTGAHIGNLHAGSLRCFDLLRPRVTTRRACAGTSPCACADAARKPAPHIPASPSARGAARGSRRAAARRTEAQIVGRGEHLLLELDDRPSAPERHASAWPAGARSAAGPWGPCPRPAGTR